MMKLSLYIKEVCKRLIRLLKPNPESVVTLAAFKGNELDRETMLSESVITGLRLCGMFPLSKIRKALKQEMLFSAKKWGDDGVPMLLVVRQSIYLPDGRVKGYDEFHLEFNRDGVLETWYYASAFGSDAMMVELIETRGRKLTIEMNTAKRCVHDSHNHRLGSHS